MRFEKLDDAGLSKFPKATRKAIAQKQHDLMQAKREHDERLRPLLPPTLQHLLDIAGSELDDALIHFLKINPTERTLDLRLLCGYNQVGYYELHLSYRNVELSEPLISMLCFIANDNHAEFVRHEVDLEQSEPPVYIHRILWRTGVVTAHENQDGMSLRYKLAPETEIRFGSFEIERIPSLRTRYENQQVDISVVRATVEARIERFLSSLTPT